MPSCPVCKQTFAMERFFLLECHVSQTLPGEDGDRDGPYATLFCRDKDGNSVSIIATGWKPWMRVLYKDPRRNISSTELWKILQSKSGVVKLEEQRVRKLYGWVADDANNTQTYSAAKVWLNRMSFCAEEIEKLVDKFPNYLAGDTLQPARMRFLHDAGLCPCGWFEVPDVAWRDPVLTTTTREGLVHWESLRGLEAVEDIPRLVLASFDCEMSSGDGLLPSPLKGDTVFCLSTSFAEFGGNGDPKLSTVSLYLGETTLTSTSKHEVRCFSTFSSLFEAWQSLVRAKDPDFVTGWNTEGFDFEFLALQYTQLWQEPCMRFGDTVLDAMLPQTLADLASAASRSQQREATDFLAEEERADVDHRNFRASAQLKALFAGSQSADNLLEDDEGQASNLGPGYTAGFGLNARQYWTIRELLGSKEVPQEAFARADFSKLSKEQKQLASEPKRDGKVDFRMGRFKHEISVPKVQKLVTAARCNIMTRIPMRGRVVFDMMGVIKDDQKPASNALKFAAETWLESDQYKLDMAPQEMFRIFKEQDVHASADLISYCARDSEIPILLLLKLQYMTSWLNLSRVCYLNPESIINGGQQQRVFSLIARRVRDTHMINIEDSGWPDTPDYVGATVIDPDPNFYDKPLSTLDFASLYPSIMASSNLCFSTLVTDRRQLAKLCASDGRPLYQDFEIEHPLPNGTIVKNNYAFVTHVKSVLSDLLIHLLSSRKAVKKQMEATDDKFLREIYNKRQMALKVVCNSCYGFTGVNVDKGMLSCKPVAATTTLIGRRLIGLTKAFVEKEYAPARVVYGDTDSVMILWGVKTLQEAFPLGEQAAAAVTKYLRTTMREQQVGSGAAGKEQRDIDAMISIVKLEHEKEYWPYILFKKKNYAGRKWTPKSVDPLVFKNEIDIKGIQAVRRDTVPWVADLSNDLLELLLREPKDGERPSATAALDLVRARLGDVVKGALPIEKFISSKALGAGAGSMANKTPHVAAWNRMKARGDSDVPPLGSRMPFVVIASKDRKAGLSDKTEHPDWVRAQGKKLDTRHYIRSAQNEVSKLLQFFDDGTVAALFDEALAAEENRNTSSLTVFVREEEGGEGAAGAATPASGCGTPVKEPARKKKKVATASLGLDAFLS